MRSKDGSTGADRRLPDERKVIAEDEAEDSRGDVEDQELERSHLSLHLRRGEALREYIDEEMDDSGVKEDGKDEAEALVGVLRGGKTAEPANLGDCTC